MSDDRKAAVSGEIVVSGGSSSSRPDASDVTDAEFETLAGGARRRSPDGEDRIATGAATVSGMDVLRERTEPPARSGPQRGGPLFWATGAALIALAFWVSGGHGIVRDLGLMKAAPVSALRIEAVSSRVDLSGARPLLFIDGGAANDGGVAEPLPPLDILVTDNDGAVTRYRMGMNGRVLAPGERYAFSSRLDVPKNGVKTVTVAFGE